MSCKRSFSLNPSNNFWVLLRILPTSSANLRIRSTAEAIGSHQLVSSFHTRTVSEPISHFLCKSILFRSCNMTTLPHVFPYRWISSSSNHQSFTVSYLTNSIGLSPKSALKVSKHVNFESPEKADKVINLFKTYGFTQPQISSLVRVIPTLLVSDSEKTILPKLEFLKAKGILGPQMTKKLSLFPSLLQRSLTKQIIPSYDFFRNFLQSDDMVIEAVKRYPDILKYNIEKSVAPKIGILQEHRVPDSKIATLILNWPISFTVSSDCFRKITKKVEDMGFDASNVHFVLAVHAFLTVDKSKWQSKVDVYKKWGWSQEDVLNAFRLRPWCMVLSEDKIMAGMDFFINQMDLKPCLIAKHPRLLSWSLKKRLVPRSSVFQVLLSKGLVKKDISLVHLFNVSDKKFLLKFVMPYKKEAPELLKLYKENLNLSNGLLIDKEQNKAGRHH